MNHCVVCGELYFLQPAGYICDDCRQEREDRACAARHPFGFCSLHVVEGSDPSRPQQVAALEFTSEADARMHAAACSSFYHKFDRPGGEVAYWHVSLAGISAPPDPFGYGLLRPTSTPGGAYGTGGPRKIRGSQRYRGVRGV
jgi:hypothetical protein